MHTSSKFSFCFRVEFVLLSKGAANTAVSDGPLNPASSRSSYPWLLRKSNATNPKDLKSHFCRYEIKYFRGRTLWRLFVTHEFLFNGVICFT